MNNEKHPSQLREIPSPEQGNELHSGDILEEFSTFIEQKEKALDSLGEYFSKKTAEKLEALEETVKDSQYNLNK